MLRNVTSFILCSLCFRYNPCSAVEDCIRFTSNTAICQSRKFFPYGTWTVGQRELVYFETSTIYSYDIDIVYPFLLPTTETTDKSIVHVKCANEGQIDTFEYKRGSENINVGDQEPQSAHFYLTTRYACPPKPSTPPTLLPTPSQTSMTFWLIVLLTFGGIITCCVCAACCTLKCWKRSTPVEQLSGHGEVALDSTRVSPAYYRASNFESREYYTSAETSAREPQSGPEVHLPRNFRSRNNQAFPQEAQWTGSQSQTRAGPHRQAPELFEPPTYETVLRLKELESSNAGSYVIAPNNQ